jgi:hypothetical protein
MVLSMHTYAKDLSALIEALELIASRLAMQTKEDRS